MPIGAIFFYNPNFRPDSEKGHIEGVLPGEHVNDEPDDTAMVASTDTKQKAGRSR